MVTTDNLQRDLGNNRENSNDRCKGVMRLERRGKTMWGGMYITYARVPFKDNLENMTLIFPKYWMLLVSLMKA